jgi:hypothetical protein
MLAFLGLQWYSYILFGFGAVVIIGYVIAKKRG